MDATENTAQQASQATTLRHLQSILDYNTDWIWEVDAQGRYTYSSNACRVLLGRPPEDVVGRTPFDFMPDGEQQRVMRIFQQYASTHSAFRGLVNRNVRPDGSIVVLETSGVPLFNPAGEFVGYRGIDRDITDIGERYLQLEAVCDFVPVPLCIVDVQRRFVMANQALAAVLGMATSAIEGQPVGQFLPGLDACLVASFAALDTLGSEAQPELEIGARWFHLTITTLPDDPRDRPRLSVAMTDITAQKNVEQELARMNRQLARHAYEDYLTGLFNRRHLDSVLRTELARAHRAGAPTSLLMLDLDHFKQYNDRFGHQAGDECLRLVADKIATVISRKGDCLGRFGGEEFMAVLPHTPPEGAHAVALRLQQAMRGLQMPEGAQPASGITLSAGVATLYPDVSRQPFDADSAASCLLQAADQALYRAKSAGRNQIVVHDALWSQACPVASA